MVKLVKLEVLSGGVLHTEIIGLFDIMVSCSEALVEVCITLMYTEGQRRCDFFSF